MKKNNCRERQKGLQSFGFKVCVTLSQVHDTLFFASRPISLCNMSCKKYGK